MTFQQMRRFLVRGSDQDKSFYVYLHRKKTDGSVFYVGKGSGHRVTSRSGRNRWWKRTVEKHGYTHEIFADGLTNEEACAIEIEKIAELRRAGVKLCNVANGGEGGLVGIPISEAHKQKLREAHTGRKQSPEHARKSATAKLGKPQPRHAVELMVRNKRKKVINSDGEVFISASHAARAMAERYSVYPSQGNISMACRGERAEAYGFAWSYDISRIPEKPSGITASMKRIRCSNGMVFNSAQDAKRWVESWRGKANNQRITECARGECRSAYGFTWEYI